jgi:hypothetical protein
MPPGEVNHPTAKAGGWFTWGSQINLVDMSNGRPRPAFAYKSFCYPDAPTAR